MKSRRPSASRPASKPDDEPAPPNADERQGGLAAMVANHWRVWLAMAVIVAFVCAAYYNSFQGVFLYDDLPSIEQNPFILKLWPLYDSMSLAMIDGGETVARRPLLSLSFAFNIFFFGTRPWGFHLVNLVIHIGAALLLFGIVRRTLLLKRFRSSYEGAETKLALAVALLWAVHPLQTESVTYIVQRAESLMGMLYLLTLYCSLRGFQSRWADYWYLPAVLACAAGMAVKEVMVAAPLVVLLYDGTFVSDSYRLALRKRWQFYACLAATWSVVLLLQYVGRSGVSNDFVKRSPWTYALTQPGVILYYLRLSIWPHPLVMDYGWPSAKSVLAVAPAGCVLLLLLGATAWAVYRRKWYGFLGACFFLYLGPSSSFVALNQNLEEHRTYLALAVVAVFVVIGVEWLLRRMLSQRPQQIQIVGTVLVVLVALLFTARTIARNRDYQSRIAMWTDNLVYRPDNTTAHLNLGRVLMDIEGRRNEAVAHFREVIRLESRAADAHNNLGVVYQQQGELEAAIAEYHEALKEDPTDADAHSNLGIVYSLQHKPKEAIAEFREALRIRPHHLVARFNLGLVLAERGRIEEAMREFSKVLAILPDHPPTHLALAGIYSSRGDFAHAIEHYQAVLRKFPDHIESRSRLAQIFEDQGNMREAVNHYGIAVALQPNSALARFNLANALEKAGRLEAAVKEYRTVVQFDSSDPVAHFNLANALVKVGSLEAAVKEYRTALQFNATDPDIHCNLGTALYQMGKLDEAAEQLNAALKLDPRHWRSHMTLGMVLFEQGERTPALAHLEEARKIEPNSPEVQALLRRFGAEPG